MTWTVIGARGFIGGTFARRLRDDGESVLALSHEQALEYRGDLGDVIYASGVAWGANERREEACRTHVDVPRELLLKELQSFLYLSSTRVYGASAQTSESVAPQVVAGDAYAETKAAGERIVLDDPRPAMRVVRLSNVYGPSFDSGLMLSDFLRQAARTGRIAVRSSSESEKDHVSVDDVVRATLQIARSGRERLYNVAAGRNTRQGDLLAAIAAAGDCAIEVPPNAPAIRFAPIDVRRIRDEFAFSARDVLADIPYLWRAFADHFRDDAARLSESVNAS